MAGRTALATPTNVYPSNGECIIFDENNQFTLSFTNHADALAYIRIDIYDCTTDENVRNVIYYNYKVNNPSAPYVAHRGDTVRIDIDKLLYEKELISGRHYKFKIILYSCVPDETGAFENVPNCCVPYASGKVLSVQSSNQIQIQSNIIKLHDPSYWGDTNKLIGCTYMRIGNEQRMVTHYESSTGMVELASSFSNEAIGNTSNLQYFLNCNYLEDGYYDFYVREEMNSETTSFPVPVGLRCKTTYTHPNNIGLENYRFKVYSAQGNNYVNGVIQAVTEGTDSRNIPLEAGIIDNIVNKRITIERSTSSSTEDIVTSGYVRKIINYDFATGIATLETGISKRPVTGTKYSIQMDDVELLSDSDSVYSYHMCYNFPIYTLGKSFDIETTLTTYEKQSLTTTSKLVVPDPELPSPITTHNLEVNDTNQNVFIEFPELQPTSGTTHIGAYNIYRREKREQTWKYHGFLWDTKTYIDYLAGNNREYEYLISKSVPVSTSITGVYDPSEACKPYQINNVETSWDGWTITAIKPFSHYENYYNKNDIRTNEVSNRLSFMFAKEPYVVGETWRFISDIDSGDITHNLGLAVHVGTSTFPTVSRTNNKYQSGSFSANILTLECPSERIYDNIEKVNRWIRFINDDCEFILKSDKGDVWIIAISDNTSRRYDESVNPILTSASYSWVETAKPDDIQVIEYKL